jgi:hypothetical protein
VSGRVGPLEGKASGDTAQDGRGWVGSAPLRARGRRSISATCLRLGFSIGMSEFGTARVTGPDRRRGRDRDAARPPGGSVAPP